MPEEKKAAALNAPAQQALTAAATILRKADIEETVLLKRRQAVDLIAGVSIFASVAALAVLVIGLVDDGRWLAFTTFVMLSSAGVAAVAAMVSRVIAWSAFVKERVDRLAAEMEADEQAARVSAYIERLESPEQRRAICERVVGNPKEADLKLCYLTLDYAAAEAREEFHYEPAGPYEPVAASKKVAAISGP